MFPFFMGGYGLYFLFSLPALILGLWAQYKVKSTFNKYSQVGSLLGLTGQQVARRILDSNGLGNIRIEQTGGILSDYYDPSNKVLRLSANVYQSSSLAAAGVAAHEVGHAIQDQQAYAPLAFRTAIVPTVQIGSFLGPIVFFVGLFLAGSIGTTVAWVGLILFAATAVFALITLPVEINASQRAKAALTNSGVLHQNEMEGVNKVLDAAAFTYIAAAIQALSTLMYYAFLLLGRRRN